MGAPLWLSVIGTALLLGIVHVMTGPDHLSALSTLSVGKPLKTAFGLGVRWGCGHSFGLLIVAIIFFAVGREVNLSVLSYWADLFVGLFMILLGVWYILKAFRERMKYLQDLESKLKDNEELLGGQKSENENENNNNNNNSNIADDNYDMSPININDNNNSDKQNEEEQIELQQISNNDENDNDNDSNNPSISLDSDEVKNEHQIKEDEYEEGGDNEERDNESDVSTKDNSEHHQLKSYQNGYNKDDIIPDDDIIIDGNVSLNPLFDPKEDSQRNKWITRIAAFIAGIFHGVAGPGGVLGVMVALKLNDWFLSSLYLILFFISSIITMGIYAITYGYFTQRMTVCANNKQKCAFILKFVSAVFSLIIGVLWLSLTFNGTLAEWFD